jgi:hypothetical protein
MDADILFAVLSVAAVGVQLCSNIGLQDAGTWAFNPLCDFLRLLAA